MAAAAPMSAGSSARTAAAATRTRRRAQDRRDRPGAWGNRVFVKLVGQHDDDGPEQGSGRLPAPGRLLADADPRRSAIRIPSIARSRGVCRVPTMTEDFDNLVFDDRTSPDFFEKRLEDNSALVAVSTAAPGPIATLPTGNVRAARRRRRRHRADRRRLQGRKHRQQPAHRPVGARARRVPRGRSRHRAGRSRTMSSTPCARIARTASSASRSSTAPSDLGDAERASIRAPTSTPQYAAFYYPWIYIADPQTRRAQAGAARRPRARHLRAHRHRARRVQGAGQRDSARRARPRVRHRRQARRTSSTRAA